MGERRPRDFVCLCLCLGTGEGELCNGEPFSVDGGRIKREEQLGGGEDGGQRVEAIIRRGSEGGRQRRVWHEAAGN